MFTFNRNSDDVDIDPKVMSDDEKVQAYILYRSKRIDEMQKKARRNAWQRVVFFWKYLDGEVTPSGQLEQAELQKGCEDYWKSLTV